MISKNMILVRSDEDRVSYYESDDAAKKPYWHQTIKNLSFFSQNPVIHSNYQIAASELEEGDKVTIRAGLLFAGEGGGVKEYHVLEEDGSVREFNGEFSIVVHCADNPDTWGRRKLFVDFFAGEPDSDDPDLSMDAVYINAVLQTERFNTLRTDIQSRTSPTIGVDVECMVIANEVTMALFDPRIHPLEIIFTSEPVQLSVDSEEVARFPGDIAEFSIVVTDDKPVKSAKEIDAETDRELEILNISGEDEVDLVSDNSSSSTVDKIIYAKRFVEIKRLLQLIFFALLAILVALIL